MNINKIISFTKQEPIYAVIFIISAVIFISFLIFGLGSQPPPPKTTTKPIPAITPLPTSSATLPNIPELKAVLQQSTDQEISKLPELKTVNTLADGSKQYLFTSPLTSKDNEIITQNGTVVFQRGVTLDKSYRHPNLSKLLALYGTPDKIIEGSKYYGQYEKTYLFLSKGIAIQANPFTEEVDEIQQFIPMTYESYLKVWGDDLNTEVPSGENLGY